MSGDAISASATARSNGAASPTAARITILRVSFENDAANYRPRNRRSICST